MPPNPRKGGKRRSGEKRRPRTPRLRNLSSADSTIVAIQSIDWDELGELFGLRTVSRGESYHEQGRVSDLRQTKDGGVVGAVRGTEVYETSVHLGEGETLDSACTCPVGRFCKHAVAIVFAILDACAAGEDLPMAGAVSPTPKPSRRSSRASRDEPGREDIHDWLQAQHKDELVARMLRSYDSSKSVRDELCAEFRLGSGHASDVIAAVEDEIDGLTAQDAWYDSWRGHGEIPDYSELGHRFRRVGEAGLHDALLDLGVRLFERGSQQVAQAHDDGETVMAICECLEIAFASLGKAGRPIVDRLLLAFDLLLRDEYGIVPQVVQSFLDLRRSSKVWSEVADRLRDGLGNPGDMSEFSARYRRSRRVAQLVVALDRSGRVAEATELLCAEASLTWNWVRVVDRMLALGDVDAANTAAIAGLEALPEQQRGERVGLRDRLRQIAERRGDLDRVAAYRADEFFEGPSLSTFEAALDAARRAGCEGRIRSWMEHFLLTGRCPVSRGFQLRNGDPARWPLPASEAGISSHWSLDEGLELLRDIAIHEKRSADVLRFHDQLRRGQHGRRAWIGADDDQLRVADAVASSHPDRAMEIYRAHVDWLLSRANTKVYAQAASLLVKIGKLMGGKRGAEWKSMLMRLREQHARKRNFIRALDRLATSPLDVARQRRSGRT